MGLSNLCPFAACTDLETSLSSVGFLDDDQAKSLVTSNSFKNQDFEPDVTKCVSSQNTRVQESFSLKKIETCSESSPKHEAATKLQKVYKSFRTRRKLADCAVLVEQNWWKVLDSEELKRSSISFFHVDQHESAVSRWTRAKTRAAKVGKGLSKNCKGQKLALQHWLEAMERETYEVAIENGKLFRKQTGDLIDTTSQTKGSKWIFVLSTTKTLYVGIKKKGSFQHSSFLSGGATLAAGRIIAEKGVLKAVWPHSGHYHPTPENFQDFISFLHENEVDTSNVKMGINDDDHDDKEYSDKSVKENKNPSLFNSFSTRLSDLEIPKNDDLLVNFENRTTETMPDCCCSDDEHDVDIEIHKETKSFQLGRQISCKWSTGAGPRIGCLRDYPLELQSHALEQAKLSPRSLESFDGRSIHPYRTRSPRPLMMNLVVSGDFRDLFD
ncbi:hypothetical protein L1987_86530 [Smallanthus sonchifolius]|uniref:Uncharacterized protein n=1 Tax=Smallanthus sonchifolius TaxID=185202 RepID=A0ACB8Y0T7_9ASTR|nr:hypothetical protein L1987_86530 [Smallanthus sonchifolius]